MKRLTFGLALTGIACLLIHACRKEEPATHYIPASLKAYAVFQAGSYWIYKNEVTGNLDSVFIANSPVFNYNHSGGYDYDPIDEECLIRYYGSFIQTTRVYYDMYTLFFKSYSCRVIEAASYKPGHVFTLGSESTLTNIASLDSMTIYNQTFYNVFITRLQRIPSQSDTSRFTSYFVKNIGLIKYNQMMDNTDTTWSLLRYHIVQ